MRGVELADTNLVKLVINQSEKKRCNPLVCCKPVLWFLFPVWTFFLFNQLSTKLVLKSGVSMKQKFPQTVSLSMISTSTHLHSHHIMQETVGKKFWLHLKQDFCFHNDSQPTPPKYHFNFCNFSKCLGNLTAYLLIFTY